MNFANYEKLLNILQKWPVNPNRVSRDFGLHLRELAQKNSAKGFLFTGDSVHNEEEKLESLQRLASNVYGKKYKINLKTGATGVPLEDLNYSLNDEAINKYNKRTNWLKFWK